MMKKWSIFQFSHPIESHSSNERGTQNKKKKLNEGRIELKGK